MRFGADDLTVPQSRAFPRRLLGLIFQLVVTAAVTWFILDRVGLSLAALEEVGEALPRPRPLTFTAATLLLLSCYGVGSLIWGRVIAGLGGPRLSARISVSIFFVANLGRYLPGKVWSIAGMAVLARRRGVPVAVSSAAAVIMQGTTLFAAGLVGMGALIGGPEPLPVWGLAGGGLAVALVVLWVTVPGVFDRAAALWFRLARSEPPGRLAPAHVLLWLLQLTAVWVATGASFWLFALSLGAELPPVQASSSFAASYVAGYVMLFAPAGIGVREGFLVAFLAPVLGPGPATALAVAARLWMTAAEVIPAAVLRVVYERGRVSRHAASDAPKLTPGSGDP